MNENPPPNPSPPPPTGAFALGLIAGIWMLLFGGVMRWGPMHAGAGHMGAETPPGAAADWVWRHHTWMGHGMAWGWVGIVAGVLVLLGAVMLYVQPGRARGWGVLVLVASVGALVAGAGGVVGGLLGIGAGLLALVGTGSA